MTEPLDQPLGGAKAPDAPGPPLSPEALLALLAEWGIASETRWHAPVFTVAESAGLKQAIPGAHTKNLFLKDKAGALFLFSAAAQAKIDLVPLAKAIGAKGRLSFAAPELLWRTLRVRPGSVTAFALVHDGAGAVQFLLDASLLQAERVHFHPLTNEATTGVSPAGLLAFCRRLERPVRLVEISEDAIRVRDA